jgi:multidrug efflux pump subunit AcrA (membrane-fusion protein)
VSETSLSSVNVDQPCEIVLDAFPDKHYRGAVSIIVPAVNRSSATVTVKVRVLDQDPKILPDMSARVAFLSQAVAAGEEKPVLAANPGVMQERDGKSVVYRISDDGRAHAVAVVPGNTLGNVRAFSGDLHAGDQLVLDPGSRVKDGSPVSVAKAK